jgi:murein DD-endopeptidase MepM/ murein hydrolase activator NlpD
MWLHRHKKRKLPRARHWTILLIPEQVSGRRRDWRIPKWTVKAGILAVLTIAVSVGLLARDYMYLRVLRDVNLELMAINQKQAREIGDLKAVSALLQEKMSEVQEFDDEVRERISLVGDGKAQTEERLLVSSRDIQDSLPSGIMQNLVLTEDADESEDNLMPDSLEELKQELEDMNQMMTDQMESLHQLKSDVEKEIVYEAALPNRWPMTGKLSSPFGDRDNPTGPGTKFHEGIDIANRAGTSIEAAGDGVVTYAGYRSGWGNMVIISHGFGYVSQYAHCQKTLVETGEQVKKGQKIATCGATGNTTGFHLHFGVAKDGKWVDPLSVLK